MTCRAVTSDTNKMETHKGCINSGRIKNLDPCLKDQEARSSARRVKTLDQVLEGSKR